MDKFLVVSSSGVRWLTSVTLSGLLLLSSVPTLATQQVESIDNSSKPLFIATSDIDTGTYTEVVRKQLQWIASPGIDFNEEEASTTGDLISSVAVTDANETTQSLETVQITEVLKSSKNKPELVEVAETSRQQVSRSGGSTLVDNALSLQGVPYVFGGTTTKGFDCSGYTQYVFNGSGSSLPRTSYEQFNAGTSVTRDNLQLGDLVFYATYDNGPSHVGIYIGGGSFVHASNSGVRTTSLDDSYYAGRYVGARRVN